MTVNMAEWDAGPHREMAVDVPDSFIGRTKTPPRYPPPKAASSSSAPAPASVSSTGSTQSVNSSPGLRIKATLAQATAATNGAAAAVVAKPALPSRDHLRIEEDGRLVNRAVPPQVTNERRVKSRRLPFAQVIHLVMAY